MRIPPVFLALLAGSVPLLRADLAVTNELGSATLTLALGGGVSGYEERVDIEPVESEWSAVMASLSAILRGRFGADGLWEVRLKGWQTEPDQETWTGQGRLFQINRMEASGASFEIAGGRQWKLSHGLMAESLVHVGARGQEFLRDRFVVDGRGVDLGEVSEEYQLALAGLSIGFRQQLTPRTGLESRLAGSWILFNEAINSLVPKDLEGQGGYLLEAQGSIFRGLSARTALILGINMELQDLTGDSPSFLEVEPSGRPSFSLVEWPDNTLSHVEATLALRIRL